MKLSRRFWLIFILLAAFAMRLYRLGATSLWYDETVSLYLAGLDLVSLTRHTAGDIHPPFYYYLLHFWGQWAGWSEFSAAFLSLFFGVLLIALVHRVACDWLTSPLRESSSHSGSDSSAPTIIGDDSRHPLLNGRGNTPLLAAFLVAISPYNLWYSQEVRMYTLAAFLGLASAYFFVRMLAGRRPQVAGFKSLFSRDFFAYAMVSALGMYTLSYFAFLLVFENLAVLIWLASKIFRSQDPKSEILNRKHLRRTVPQDVAVQMPEISIWLSSQLAILLLFLPWLPIAYKQAANPPVPPWRSFVSLPDVLLESFSALALGQSVDWQSPSWVWLVLITIAGIITFALLDRPTIARLNSRSLALLGYTLVPLLIIYTLSLWKPLYHVRYIFTYSPAFCILLALGIDRMINYQFTTNNYWMRLASRFALVAFGLLLLVSSAYSASNYWFNPQYADDDLRGAVKHISELWRPGDAVLVNAGYTYTAFVYYFDHPVAWRGRLTNYPPTNVSLGTYQRIVDQRAGAVVLQTGSIGGDANLGWGSAESDFYATTADETRAALDRVFATHPRVWMLRLYDTVVDPDGIVRDYFAQHARLMDDQVFTGLSNVRAQGYLTSREPVTQLPLTATRREIFLGNRITFLGFEPAQVTVRAGEPIGVNLYWRAREATNADMRVYIGLYREDGSLAAGTIEQPLGNGLGTSRWGSDEVMREPARLIAPKILSRGNYVLQISMFNPFTNEPLEPEKSEWVVDGTQIRLTQVTVEK